LSATPLNLINSSIDKQARAQAIVKDLILSKFIEEALINYLPAKTVIAKPIVNVIKKNKRKFITQIIKETVTTQESNNPRIINRQEPDQASNLNILFIFSLWVL
jgi:hypothetical protein